MTPSLLLGQPFLSAYVICFIPNNLVFVFVAFASACVQLFHDDCGLRLESLATLLRSSSLRTNLSSYLLSITKFFVRMVY